MIRSLRSGFTLIELLVVIAIIGILSTIGLTTFSNAQMRARDARRRSNLKDMQSAFEQYYVENGNLYAATCGAMDNAMQGSTLPVDPRGGAPYSCTSTAGTPSTYCACAALEIPNSGNSSNNACNFTTGVGANFFCVRNLQ